MMQIDQILGSHPAMQSRTQIIGFSFLGGQGNTYGSFICKLKPWDERTGKGMDANSVIGALYMAIRHTGERRSRTLFRSAYDSRL